MKLIGYCSSPVHLHHVNLLSFILLRWYNSELILFYQHFQIFQQRKLKKEKVDKQTVQGQKPRKSLRKNSQSPEKKTKSKRTKSEQATPDTENVKKEKKSSKRKLGDQSTDKIVKKKKNINVDVGKVDLAHVNENEESNAHNGGNNAENIDINASGVHPDEQEYKGSFDKFRISIKTKENLLGKPHCFSLS